MKFSRSETILLQPFGFAIIILAAVLAGGLLIKMVEPTIPDSTRTPAPAPTPPPTRESVNRTETSYKYIVDVADNRWYCDVYKIVPNGILLLPDTIRIVGPYVLYKNRK